MRSFSQGPVKSQFQESAWLPKTCTRRHFFEENLDPFEKSRECKATVGQIRIINSAMFVLGLFSTLMAVIAYTLEFEDKDDPWLYSLLTICMISSLIEMMILSIKLKTLLQLHI
jgi:uncharacterized cysteine cluster protein YcgN (CxxCxxCC family)